MKTPLYNSHVSLNAKIAPFGEWDMPIQYSGIINEHLHTRKSAGLFDICHMGEFIVKGPAALDDLENLITAGLGKLKIGRCKYGFLLNETGGVIDDLITYRVGEDEYMLVVNSATTDNDFQWIKTHLSPTTILNNITDKTGKIDLQGPMSREIIQVFVPIDLSTLKYFSFIETTVNNIKVILSRTGYTGELGYEIYSSADDVEKLWKLLLEDERVLPAGLGARDTLRLEMGLPLYGHELTTKITPVAAGLTFAVNTDKKFIGDEHVIDEINSGTDKKMVGLILDGRQSCRAGQQIMTGNDLTGEITSGSYAPSIGRAIALAYTNSKYSSIGTEVQIDTGRKLLSAVVCDLPFYKEGTARINPNSATKSKELD